MKSSNYKAKEEFSDKELQQTDFGKIYFNTPCEVHTPKTVEQLSGLLKDFNEKNVPVTIRNTGHSVNGQTLTDGVQVSVANMEWVSFDEDKKEVSVGAGTSWDMMLKNINFPAYCPPVFPNNPNQEIKVGGTAAVGGIGFFSSHFGGFWNHVKRIKLVTMTGEVLDCSREKNADYFRYSLGGLGRIGVIAEVTIALKQFPEKIYSFSVGYRNRETFVEKWAQAIRDPLLFGVISFQAQASFLQIKLLGFSTYGFTLFANMDAVASFEEFQKYIDQNYNGYVKLAANPFYKQRGRFLNNKSGIPLADIVYEYPDSEFFGQYELSHPWSDYILPLSKVGAFLDICEKLLCVNKWQQYGLKKGLHGNNIVVTFNLLNYGSKSFSKETNVTFPLCLDDGVEDFMAGIGVDISVPNKDLSQVLSVIDQLTDICYEMGGKRYLYGYHNLTRQQVIAQFGEKTIKEWQELKRKLDPKNLLNIGVIEHLDS